MGADSIKITVYGREVICASCVGAPGSRETYEWLQAAIGRKYHTENIEYEYVDIDRQYDDPEHREFIEEIFAEDMLYPIVFVNDKMAAEGIPKVKTIYRALDENGAAVKT